MGHKMDNSATVAIHDHTARTTHYMSRFTDRLDEIDILLKLVPSLETVSDRRCIAEDQVMRENNDLPDNTVFRYAMITSLVKPITRFYAMGILKRYAIDDFDRLYTRENMEAAKLASDEALLALDAKYGVDGWKMVTS